MRRELDQYGPQPMDYSTMMRCSASLIWSVFLICLNSMRCSAWLNYSKLTSWSVALRESGRERELGAQSREQRRERRLRIRTVADRRCRWHKRGCSADFQS